MLYELVSSAGVSRLAIIGLAKHAGKTTALNTILDEAAAEGTDVYAVSIGVDGERFDVLVGAEKPAINAPAGTWLAMATQAAERAEAKLEWVELTGIPSPLGEIVIARVIEPGAVQLAGVRQLAHVKQLQERFTKHMPAEKNGRVLQLIDGAFDRMASADPELADGIILCTGASVGRSIDQVAVATRIALKRLQLPVVMEDWQRQAARLSRDTGKQVAAGPDILPRLLSGNSPLLRNPLIGPEWPKGATLLAFPGAVTDRVLKNLAGKVQTLVLPNATHLLCSTAAWKQFERNGGRILVDRSIRIVAVTVNARSIDGFRLRAGDLLARIREEAAGLPVIDCLHPEYGNGI